MSMQFVKKATMTLTPVAPFAFDATFHKPDHFPSADNHWQPDVRWQTWRHEAEPLGLKITNNGTVDKPSILVDVFAKNKLDTKSQQRLADDIVYRYNLNLDLAPFYKQFASDQVLGPIIQKWRGMRPGHAGNLYEYIVIGLMLQNTQVRRSVHMLQTLFEHYGTKLEFDGHQLWCFWQPGDLARVSEDELRALKIGYRAKSLKRIDTQLAGGTVDERALRLQPRDEQAKALLAIYGVGPATVWYLLFDVFHHLDFFDHISPWEQKIYSKLFFDRDPENPVTIETLQKRFASFAPYQQLAVHYIWEDLWWRRTNDHIDWLEKLIRL